ncbi:unnamed protein product, partial [Owenia fusiformis]
KCKADVFTSVAKLEVLLLKEIQELENIEKYIEAEEFRITELKRISRSIKMMNPVNTSRDREMYITHPINAFHLVRRAAFEWDYMYALLNDHSPHERFTNDTTHVEIGDNDYIGSIDALLRIQSVYELNTSDMALGKISGRRSIEHVSAEECIDIARVSAESPLIPNAAEISGIWAKEALLHNPSTLDRYEAMLIQAESLKRIGRIKESMLIANRTTRLQIANNIDLYKDFDARWDAIGNQTSNDHGSDKDHEPRGNHNPINEEQWLEDEYRSLCRGETKKTPLESKGLICQYRKGAYAYAVFKEEILHTDPLIAMFHDVITDEEVALLKQLSLPNLDRARVGDDEFSDIRISQVSWIADEDDPRVSRLTRRIKHVTGLETETDNILLPNAEDFQVLNYGMGGHYEVHFDFNKEDEGGGNISEHIRLSGDRLATFLFYLNDVEAGGATVFPRAKVRVPPVKNAAAFWFNCKRSGEFDYRSLHAGCPVIVGQKWVANKWILEKGQIFARPCGLSPSTRDV